jgi:hypothetical protein
MKSETETEFFWLRSERVYVSVVLHRSDSSDAGNSEILQKERMKINGTELTNLKQEAMQEANLR